MGQFSSDADGTLQYSFRLVEHFISENQILYTEYYHDTIFAVGGRSGKRPVSAIESLELKTNQWTSWMNIPTPRAFASISMAAGHLIITGGLGNDCRKGFNG